MKINIIRDILDKELDFEHGNSAAVLVPIIKPSESVTKLLMIQRSMDLKRNAGEVAFPGGLREGNETPEETALREFEEELGLDDKFVRILGFLKPEIVKEHGIFIYPVVGLLRVSDENVFVPGYEVREILIEELRKIFSTRKPGKDGITFEFRGHIVWGASSRILDDIYRRIEKNSEKLYRKIER